METSNIPIPAYPLFQLRSLMIDKDPVIWAHLLRGYIELCKVLLGGEVRLDAKSTQQLQLFVKVFLSETASEATQIFSLGAINPDIMANTTALRAYVFQLICDHGVVKLAMSGESLWNFALCYMEKNALLVRGVIGGTHKSKFNDNKKSGKISLAPVLRKFLLGHITLGKMGQHDVSRLAMLLGQHTASAVKTVSLSGEKTHQKVLARDKYGRLASPLQFAESFVTTDWLEDLELMYSGGRNVNAATIRDVMVVSLLSVLLQRLKTLLDDMGVKNKALMAICPLVMAILTSDTYLQMNPTLHEKIPFLADATLQNIDFLCDMFPSLTPSKARVILENNEGDVQRATSALLEDPLLIESTSEPEMNAADVKVSASELERGIERFKLAENETTESFGKKAVSASTEEIKKNTLQAALRLLYDADEDERDDTYDDQEHTTGAKAEAERESTPIVVRRAEFDKNEVWLFGFLKADQSLFSKTSRKAPKRKSLRTTTGWTDEQIEGWARMLLKSPKRFRLLEEEYMLHNRNKPAKEVEEALGSSDESDSEKQEKRPSRKSTPKPKEPELTQRMHQKKEANKAKRANHSRKSGHERKTKSQLAGLT